VDDHAQRLARRLDLAHGELRIVRAHRADPREDRAGPRAPAVAVAPRLGTGDPLRTSIGKRGAPIECSGHLEPHPGPAARDAREKTDVEFALLLLQQTVLETHTRRGEALAS